jgi:hypothetical protein
MRIRALFAALALVLLGVTITAAPVGATGVAQSYSSCTGIGRSGYVCLDETTGFGPVLYIFDSNGTTYTSGVTLPSPSYCSSFATTSNGGGVDDFSRDNDWAAKVRNINQPTPCQSSTFIIYDPALCPPGGVNVACLPTSSFSDLVEFYANVPGYEFVYAN